MTTNEWVVKQRNSINRIKNGEALEIAVKEVHRLQANRIFNDGLASDGTSIGNYNTNTPIYVNPKNSPKSFSPKGKPGAIKKIKDPKTRWFPSYSAFRSSIGREVSRVNLDLSSLLRRDFVAGLREVSKTVWESFLSNAKNRKKAAGMEKHFGKKIFTLTQTERAAFSEIMQAETNRIMNA